MPGHWSLNSGPAYILWGFVYQEKQGNKLVDKTLPALRITGKLSLG